MADRTCSIEGCDGSLNSRGLCGGHYARWRKFGDPLAGGPLVRLRFKRTDPCRVPECTRLSESLGLCMTHYHRQKRHGDVDRGLQTVPIRERFMAKVRVTEAGCWQWTSAVDRKGYGHFTTTRRVSAHRWSYEHHVGPIPDGLEIDHLCRNTGCVNPEHMEPVTRAENLRREHVARRTR